MPSRRERVRRKIVKADVDVLNCRLNANTTTTTTTMTATTTTKTTTTTMNSIKSRKVVLVTKAKLFITKMDNGEKGKLTISYLENDTIHLEWRSMDGILGLNMLVGHQHPFQRGEGQKKECAFYFNRVGIVSPCIFALYEGPCIRTKMPTRSVLDRGIREFLRRLNSDVYRDQA
jgi:hypothetical protein